jgi:hypothetical protein
MKYLSFFVLTILLFINCNIYDREEPDLIVSGYQPVYGEISWTNTIKLSDTMAISDPGRIVYLSPYLFITENGSGVHVINNANPENPVKEAFIQIPFNRDIAVQNNIIYADNDRDLVSFKYYSKDSIRLIAREKDVFDRVSGLPEDYRGYFECIDESKGKVIGWIEAQLINPKCRTF